MITVTFKDFDDMVAFGLRLAGSPGRTAQPPVQPVQQPPVQPVQQPPVQPVQQPPVQTSVRAYALDDLSQAAMPLLDAGRQAELVGLLYRFGVESLPALAPEQYGAFATALRGMGAPI